MKKIFFVPAEVDEISKIMQEDIDEKLDEKLLDDEVIVFIFTPKRHTKGLFQMLSEMKEQLVEEQDTLTKEINAYINMDTYINTDDYENSFKDCLSERHLLPSLVEKMIRKESNLIYPLDMSPNYEILKVDDIYKKFRETLKSQKMSGRLSLKPNSKVQYSSRRRQKIIRKSELYY